MLLHAETCPLPWCCSSARLQSTHSLLLSQTHTYASGKSRMALLVRAFAFVSYFPLQLSLRLIREGLRKDKLSLNWRLYVPCPGSWSYHVLVTRMSSDISVCTNQNSVPPSLRQGPHGETLCLDLVFPLLPLCRVWGSCLSAVGWWPNSLSAAPRFPTSAFNPPAPVSSSPVITREKSKGCKTPQTETF